VDTRYLDVLLLHSEVVRRATYRMKASRRRSGDVEYQGACDMAQTREISTLVPRLCMLASYAVAWRIRTGPAVTTILISTLVLLSYDVRQAC
jgi:hypothetical protein